MCFVLEYNHDVDLCVLGTDTECSGVRLETAPPIATEQVEQTLIGRMKGIQGHCNSCYMDAALFR